MYHKWEVKIVIDLHVTHKENHGPLTFIAYASNDDVRFILNHQLRGTVHSTFNHSFNVRFGQRLIHIGSLENGLAPFGIGMSPEDATYLTKQIKVGNKVYWKEESQTLTFNHGIVLSLKQLIVVNHTLISTTYDRNVLRENAVQISHTLLKEKWVTGLVETSDAKKQLISFIMNEEVKQHTRLLLEVKKLRSFIEGEQLLEEEAELIFNYWIGRGPGLTPSGDDMMTGICAILSSFRGEKDYFVESLKAYLQKHGEKRTTHVSLEYLSYAVSHKYHSHVVNLTKLLSKPADATFREALDEVGNLGQTSGTDTLIGTLLGAYAIIDHL